MKPLIGITTANQNNAHGWPYYVAYHANVAALVRAGGLPVLIPNGLADDVTREIYERLDGVLLPGGGDVDPELYGETQHELTKKVDKVRDALEVKLAKWAVADDLPVLGICRGHQILNVALGGRLVQDVGTMVETDIVHDMPFTMARNSILHEVNVEADSKLATILGKTTVPVNSLHHQAVVETGPNVRVTAYAPDGMIEAIELPDKYYVVSVQWHPEDLVNDHEAAQRLFKSFVDAAKERMSSKNS